jgi:biopolymer transport protein TolR
VSFGRLARRAGAKPMSEINMTPLIDVMLVLLVIFIISAPLIARSLQLDLPASDASGSSQAPASVALAIDAEGRFYIDEERLDEATAQARIGEHARAAARRNPATEVQLRADSRVPYGRVAEMIGWLQQAGLTRIGLVTQPPAPVPAPPAAGG